MQKSLVIVMLVCWLVPLATQAAYVDNGATLTDTVTGLEWQKATMGPMTWKQGLAAAENLILVGKSGWRLPDKNELRSLVDYSRYFPAIDPVFSATTKPSYYWSSTTFTNSPYGAWLVHFYNGNVNYDNKSAAYYVRAVRGRQLGTLGYLTTQVRPDPVIPDANTRRGRKAVVLTHGWNSNVQDWAVGMAAKICMEVGGTVPETDPLFRYANKLSKYCSTPEWDVFVYDWRTAADTKAPWSAWANAVEYGTALGITLAKKDYTHVHLLAHSAGSMLIDSAKNWLRRLPGKPFIHLTFFDAYDPFAQIKNGVQLSAYGQGADWVDNYVDKRPVAALFGTTDMGGTQLLMPYAYNVDVTQWDIRPAPDDPYNAALSRHAWPHLFYAQETFMAMAFDLGFALSREAGKTVPGTNRQKKTVCTLPKRIAGTTTLACESVKPVADLGITPDKIYTIGDTSVVLKEIIKSVTGVVNFINDPKTGLIQYWTFQTGSPVWAKMELDIKEPVNALTFDCKFLSATGAEGYLTVFVDNNVVGSLDERHLKSAGAHAGKRMYIGELEPGIHALAVRVDPYTTVQSSVQLSNLKLVYVKREAIFPPEM